MNFIRDDSGASKIPLSSINLPWQEVDIISSNCPVHIGIKLIHLGDNQYQCPRYKEIYKAKGSVANETNKDRFDIGYILK